MQLTRYLEIEIPTFLCLVIFNTAFIPYHCTNALLKFLGIHCSLIKKYDFFWVWMSPLSSATLLSKTHNILTMSILVLSILCQQLFSEKFITYALTAGLVEFIIKVSKCFSKTSCLRCFLILLPSNIVSSKVLFRYAKSISRCLASQVLAVFSS